MQLMIYINLESPLILPVNYNHILQAVIYQGIGKASDFGNFMHEEGYYLGQRQYKMFQFSQLSGKYSIKNNQIVFRNQDRKSTRLNSSHPSSSRMPSSA